MPRTRLAYAGRGSWAPRADHDATRVWRSTAVRTSWCHKRSSSAHRCQGRGPGDRVHRQSGARWETLSMRQGKAVTDFFISYTSVDRFWAEWIAWMLEEAKYTTVVQA